MTSTKSAEEPLLNLKNSVTKDNVFGLPKKVTEEESGEKKKEVVKTLDDLVTLKDIDVKIKKGEFTCIIGDVGSGKSSLLSAIIGDLLYVSPSLVKKYGENDGFTKIIDDDKSEKFQEDLIEGIEEMTGEPPIHVDGNLSYVEQIPWIQNKTIRDNILFGQDIDKVKYVDTIQLCELTRDLEILPNGDLTEIGEKGINLSGGQKARISIARAVYSNKDTILMDDPISALDANVRKKIFMNLILGSLKNKTRVLVTHAIDFIHLADKIIIMEKGRIIANDTYQNLQGNEQLEKLLKINQINQTQS